MTRTSVLVLGVATLAVASCTTMAPVRVAAGDQCFRCRRTIVDARLAGETIDSSGFVSKFRAPGCMATYLVAHTDERATLFVTDYSTGTMVSPDRAIFVPVLIDSNTGERDYLAYLAPADADAAALQAHTLPVSWDVVLERAR